MEIIWLVGFGVLVGLLEFWVWWVEVWVVGMGLRLRVWFGARDLLIVALHGAPGSSDRR